MELSNDLSQVGIVALSDSGKYFDVFQRRRVIEAQLIWRNFDRSRIMFVRRKDLPPLATEMWKVPRQTKVPFQSESAWPYEVREGEKPFVLLRDGFDESECFPPDNSEFVAQFLKANRNSRTNIVIKANKKTFRELRRDFNKDLTLKHGIARNRFRFYYVPIRSIYYSYEFWILN